MKLNLLAIIGLCILSSSGSSQPVPQGSNRWKAAIKVVDENGLAVPRAAVTIGFYMPPVPGESIGMDKVSGHSDLQGLFVGSHEDRSSDLFIAASKPGYYKTTLNYELGPPYAFEKAKWNPTLTLVLKRIVNPIPMYAKRVNLAVPRTGEDVGFDFKVGDWVAPLGKGKEADMLFKAVLSKRAEDDFDFTLTVTFPNPADGIQESQAEPFPLGQGSALRSPHEAPDLGYQAQWVQTQVKRPGEPLKSNRLDSRMFFFRTHTVLDEKGQVRQAQYGKLYGDFLRFTYYLNPSLVSRHIEFDTDKNLCSSLRSLEQVDSP